MTEPSPKTLGRYELREELGRGTMGLVYKAFDPALDRLVALKTVRIAFAVPDDAREAFETRFLAEARAAGALSHPGIVVVHDVGRDPATGTLYIAFECLQGQTLAQMTAGGVALPWREALRITGRLAEALHHAHAQGIVHRDIKPANVMLLASGEPKVMDFGIAKLPASQLTATGQLFGTPSYMSPEQARGETVDARSDIFSLGAVLYLTLTGRPAFEAPSVPAILSRVVTLDPPPPSASVPGLPAAVDDVIARALAKERGARYPDGRTLAEDVQDVLGGRTPRHSVPATRVSPAKVAAPPPPPRRVVLALGALGLLALLGVVGLFVSRGYRALLFPLAPASSAAPAHLEIVFQHGLRSGDVRVWVDDELVLEEPLESRVTGKVLSYRFRKGSVQGALDVPPGEHVIRVEVEGEWNGSRRIRGTFESGVTRRLEARVGGIVKKELSLDWLY